MRQRFMKEKGQRSLEEEGVSGESKRGDSKGGSRGGVRPGQGATELPVFTLVDKCYSLIKSRRELP